MKRCDKLVDVGRRQFMRGGAVAAAATAPPRMNWRLPTSTSLSHLFMVFLSLAPGLGQGELRKTSARVNNFLMH